MRMNTLPSLQADCYDGDVHGTGDTDARTYFDGPFNTRLGCHMSARLPMRPSPRERTTHQGSRDTRVSDQKVCVRTTRYSHKRAHLLVEPEPILGPLPRGSDDV